jgi:hypothetical protein
MYNLNKKEMNILKKLNSPAKIQDFINKLKTNFEEKGETCMSPRRVLREKKAHCIEAAFLAHLAFKINNMDSWVVDLKGNDWDHVICIFKKEGFGCISKSNHAAHRYREPIYRDVRELVMSMFHEYIDDNGNKTLREFSEMVDLSVFGEEWVTDEKELWWLNDALEGLKHFPILSKEQENNLRKADKIEIEAGKITEYQKIDL